MNVDGFTILCILHQLELAVKVTRHTAHVASEHPDEGDVVDLFPLVEVIDIFRISVLGEP